MRTKNALKAVSRGAAFAVFTLILLATLSITAHARVDQNERAIIDFRNTPNTGTVSIRLARSVAPMQARVRIEKGGMTYNYHLRNDGTAELFPLQMGNGDYSIRILIGPAPDGSGRFAVALAATYNLNLSERNRNAVFLNPNQFVNFNRDSQLVTKAAEIIRDARARTTLEKVEALYRFIVDEFDYDIEKAKRVIRGEMTGYVPNPDEILAARTGICFDYTSLLAAMLRSQGIPAKLITGHVSNPDPRAPAGSVIYHAWNEFYLPERGGWFRINEMRFDGRRFERLDPTFEATSRGSNAAMRFIGDGTNYTTIREF